MSERKNNILLLAISVLFVLFFPTSINGIIFPNMWMVKNILGLIISIWIFSNYKLDYKAKCIGLASFFILCFFTIWGLAFANPRWGDLRIAWASVSGFIPTCIIWCISFDNLRFPSRIANNVLVILSLILIIWGWGLVLKYPSIEAFTYRWYSSLNDNMLSNMLSRGKPVMSFSTHSLSAFFVTLFFYLHCIALRHRVAGIMNYVCMLLLFLLVIPMTSNTAIVMLGIMVALFLWSSKSNATKFILLIVCSLCFFYFWNSGLIGNYIDEIVNGTNADAHGIEARYKSDFYSGNIEVISSIGGIGFLRSSTEFFEMKDSGFLYLLTQGNIIVLFLIYYLRYIFYKRNQQQYVSLTLALFFLLETITASAYISVKVVFAEILVILFINSFVSNNVLFKFKKK